VDTRRVAGADGVIRREIRLPGRGRRLLVERLVLRARSRLPTRRAANS
jgi:hypothetical protein